MFTWFIDYPRRQSAIVFKRTRNIHDVRSNPTHIRPKSKIFRGKRERITMTRLHSNLSSHTKTDIKMVKKSQKFCQKIFQKICRKICPKFFLKIYLKNMSKNLSKKSIQKIKKKSFKKYVKNSVQNIWQKSVQKYVKKSVQIICMSKKSVQKKICQNIFRWSAKLFQLNPLAEHCDFESHSK